MEPRNAGRKGTHDDKDADGGRRAAWTSILISRVSGDFEVWADAHTESRGQLRWRREVFFEDRRL